MHVGSTSILLAEDDFDDRTFFREFLEDRQDIFLMEEVENGEDLLETLDALEDDALPDMIILDQNMPRLNGLETLHVLKNNIRYKEIPVMVYSTYINDHLIEECKKAGASRVATKPVNKKGYEKMIDEFFEVVTLK